MAQGLGEARLTRPAPTAWNKQAEEYAQFLYLQPSTCVEDLAVVIMLSEIEATKGRTKRCPHAAPGPVSGPGAHRRLWPTHRLEGELPLRMDNSVT